MVWAGTRGTDARGPLSTAASCTTACAASSLRRWRTYPPCFRAFAPLAPALSLAWVCLACLEPLPADVDPELNCQLSGRFFRECNKIAVGGYVVLYLSLCTIIVMPSSGSGLARLFRNKSFRAIFWFVLLYSPAFLMFCMSVIIWTWLLRLPACTWTNKDLYVNRCSAAVLVNVLNTVLLCWHPSIRQPGEREVPLEPPPSLLPVELAKRMTEDMVKRTLQHLDTVKYDEQYFVEMGLPQECAICLIGLDEKAKIKLTKCGHAFHEDCFAIWLQRQQLCPVCRQDVLTGQNLTKVKVEERNTTNAGEPQRDEDLEQGLPGEG